ncbi:MAG: hypothetical protein U1C53_00250, partial [Candidatus Veblenbacteria bacterium]|nr:hypothetical protein [Candidatus Veblenbacteria bacterium]
ILRHYAGRSNRRGHGEGFILNTEELATLYHFPVVTVKAPLVKKTEAKKAEPPFGLPVYQPGRRLAEPQPAAATGKGAAPGNLPTVE